MDKGILEIFGPIGTNQEETRNTSFFAREMRASCYLPRQRNTSFFATFVVLLLVISEPQAYSTALFIES
jgi:hypothetical protein